MLHQTFICFCLNTVSMKQNVRQFVRHAYKQKSLGYFQFNECFIKHCVTVCPEPYALSTRIRFHTVFIETTHFSLRFHLASTRKRLKTISSENSLQREQYENDTKTMCTYNYTIVAFSLKTILFSMKTYLWP